MVRWLFLIGWTMHGLGQVAGVLAGFLPKASGFKLENPWILPGNALVIGPAGKAWALAWATAFVFVLASSWGLFTGAEWWRQAALIGAIATIVAAVPWARTVMPGALVGAAFAAGVAVMVTVPLGTLLRLVER